MHYSLRFVASSGHWKNEARKAKAGKRCRKKEAVVPVEAGGSEGTAKGKVCMDK